MPLRPRTSFTSTLMAQSKRQERDAVFTAPRQEHLGCSHLAQRQLHFRQTPRSLPGSKREHLFCCQEKFESRTDANAADEQALLIFTTHSAAVINALGRPTTRSDSIAQCHAALQNISDRHTVIIKNGQRVMAHAQATTRPTLARAGATQTPTSKDISLCKRSSAEIKNSLKMFTQKEHQKLWERRSNCKHTKTMLPGMNKH